MIVKNDIAYTDNEKPLIRNGDFVVEDAQQLHIRHLILGNKGDFRQWGMVGVGLRTWLLDEDALLRLKHEITKQLQLDGFVIERLKLNDQIEVAAHYGS